MKVLKKVLCIMLSILIITTIFSGCTPLNPDNVKTNITKGEWIKTLGQHFGMDDANTDENYFDDISAENDIYPYVQACVDWNIINKAPEFDENKKINHEFALATITFALGSDFTGIERNNTSDKEAASYAIDLGIGQSKSWTYMHKGIDEDEASELVTSAARIYCGKTYETYDNSKLVENVKKNNDESSYRFDHTTNEIFVDSADSGYSIGDVVIFGEGADAEAVKVTDISYSDGKTVLSVKQPELQEVYEHIDAAGTSTIESADQINPVAGVTVSNFNGVTMTESIETPEITPLGTAVDNTSILNMKKDDKIKNGSSFTLDVEVSDGMVKVNPKASWGDNGELSADVSHKDQVPDIKDPKGDPVDFDVLQDISTKKNKYTGGWKIKGSVTISDFTTTANVDTKKFLGVPIGFNSFDVSNDFNVSSSLSLVGYFNRDITIAEPQFPIGPFQVGLKIKLYYKLNGEIGVSITGKVSNSVTYSKDNGTKKISATSLETSKYFKATVEGGLKIAIELKIVGIALLDFTGSAGIKYQNDRKFTALWLSKEGLWQKGGDEAYLTDKEAVYLICINHKLILPIIKIGIGLESDTVANKLGISYEWKIMDEKDAPLKSLVIPLHWEYNKGFVDSCSIDKYKTYEYENPEEAKEDDNYEATTKSNEDLINDSIGLQIDKYSAMITVGETEKIHIINLPKGFAVGDISVVSDNNDIAYFKGLGEDQDGEYITIFANSEGTATVEISLNGTNETLKCAIFVTE